jgi:hypothetical protein
MNFLSQNQQHGENLVIMLASSPKHKRNGYYKRKETKKRPEHKEKDQKAKEHQE